MERSVKEREPGKQGTSKTGSGHEDNVFVREHEDFVRSIASKIRNQTGTGELEDLIAAGLVGLFDARKRYDPRKGVAFKTFAYYRVRGSIFDGIRSMTQLPRRAYEKVRTLEMADQTLASLGENNTQKAQDLESAVDTLRVAVGQLATAFAVATLASPDAEKEQRTPDAALEAKQTSSRLHKAVAALPERERALIQGSYFEGRRFDEVAEELGISKSWASRLHLKALAQLKRALKHDQEP